MARHRRHRQPVRARKTIAVLGVAAATGIGLAVFGLAQASPDDPNPPVGIIGGAYGASTPDVVPSFEEVSPLPESPMPSPSTVPSTAPSAAATAANVKTRTDRSTPRATPKPSASTPRTPTAPSSPASPSSPSASPSPSPTPSESPSESPTPIPEPSSAEPSSVEPSPTEEIPLG